MKPFPIVIIFVPFFILLAFKISWGQTVAPSVATTGGSSGTLDGGAVNINWTIGQIAVSTEKTANNAFTQGFQQPLTCPLIVQQLVDTICLGEQYRVGNSLYLESGNYEDVLKATNFSLCDSIVQLQLVVIDPSSDLPSAAAEDLIVCEPNPTQTLLADPIPEYVSGRWTSPFSSIAISNPTNPQSNVGNLTPGANFLIWALSNKFCPDYDNTEVSIFYDDAQPTATADEFIFALEQEEHMGNLLANDQFPSNPPFKWRVELQDEPFFVALTEPLGTFSLLTNGFRSLELVEAQKFQYTVINDNCPSRFDTAGVLITFETSDEFDESIAMTPNSDGDNDTFIIPELALFPEKFTKNELIVFNRWGDIIYQAAPYDNKWDGTYNGKPLPAGTYYYIMRLDLGNAKIKQGQITILR